MRPRSALLTAACAAVIVLANATLATGDSFTPVRLVIKIAPVARLHQPLKLTIGVTADAAALDGSGPMYMRVKFTSECGGTYQYTPGDVLINDELSPQPVAGQPYSASVTGSGKPTAYGVQTVCVWLEESGDDRVFASSQDVQVSVSKPCTTAALRYDKATKALARARRRMVKRTLTGAARRRAVTQRSRAITRAHSLVVKDHAPAAQACGPGVPL